jgi:hypothetical protein
VNCSRANRGKWRSDVTCTGSACFHLNIKSSVVHPSIHNEDMISEFKNIRVSYSKDVKNINTRNSREGSRSVDLQIF